MYQELREKGYETRNEPTFDEKTPEKTLIDLYKIHYRTPYLELPFQSWFMYWQMKPEEINAKCREIWDNTSVKNKLLFIKIMRIEAFELDENGGIRLKQSENPLGDQIKRLDMNWNRLEKTMSGYPK
jgi:hypothetical protein